MRDAVPPCGTTGGGGGAGTSPAAARATPDARTADPAAPDPPTHPEATRAGRHGRPPRPTALNDPSHHTRETHSDALATVLRTRRTCPSRPSPRPSRSTPSKPPLNNIPGAWCSLTARAGDLARWAQMSQCTYRCVVLPDNKGEHHEYRVYTSQCTYRCVVLPDELVQSAGSWRYRLNAPTGTWCSLTSSLPTPIGWRATVSMHLQVRGAP